MSKSTADLFPVSERKPARRAAPKWHPKRSHGFAAALAVVVEAGKQRLGAGALPPITLTGAPAPRMGTPKPPQPSVLTVRAVGTAVSTFPPAPPAQTPSTTLQVRVAPAPAVNVGPRTAAQAEAPQAETARCPRCGLEGDVAHLFGYRKVDGKQRAQSWCRDCRRVQRPSSSSRLIAEAEQYARRQIRDRQLDDLPLWSSKEGD